MQNQKTCQLSTSQTSGLNMRCLKWIVCAAALFTSVECLAKPAPIDGIAAVVNESIIPKSVLAQHVRLISQQIEKSSGSAPDLTVLEKQVLEHLVLNEIQLQMAKRTGIQVNETDLDMAIENIAKQSQMTVTQLREALVQEGVNFDHYRENIRNQMVIHQLQQRDLMHEIHVSDQEIKQFLQSPNGLLGMSQEFRLSHILIPLSESPSPEEIDAGALKAKHIVDKLRQGQDFAQVALAESHGQQALNGGDLGWRKLPELPTLFEKIVGTLSLGDIPDPIRSNSGFHVIKLVDKRNAAQMQTAVEKTLVRHILIKTNAMTSDQDAEQRLRDILQKIKNGDDFAKLASAHSADLGSASNGGSLGWVTQDVLVPEFSSKMQTLAVNELSEPFQSPFGWHIMQVMDRKVQNDDQAALRQKAKEMIQQRKYEEKLQTWGRQLRDEAYVITYYDKAQ